jgi:hypothetical protein
MSWDEVEISAPTDGEDRSAKARQPSPPPHTKAATELRLQETTLVEGMHPVVTSTHYVE